MRTVTSGWTGNQAEDVSCQSRLEGFVETRRSEDLLRQTAGSLAETHPGGAEGVLGQVFVFDNFVVEQLAFTLSMESWSGGYGLDVTVWSYDPNTDSLISLVVSGQTVIAGNFPATEKVFTLDTPTELDGTYAALIYPPLSGTLKGYYAVGNRYPNGAMITAPSGTTMTEHTGEDLKFRVIGHPVSIDNVRRWETSNTTDVDNVTEASVKAVFDPSAATLPFESCSVTIENGVYSADDEIGARDYDFTDLINRTALKAPGVVDVSLGYRYDDDTRETLHMTRQRLASVSISEDEQYVTFEGVSFLDRLENTTFYGGRYDAAGIEAATLFAEVLDDAQFPTEGQWNYRIGAATCKVSAAGTRPLWGLNYVYYHIDPTLTTKVYLPIPPVSHREALTMLAAYAGAYMRMREDGSLDVLPVETPTVLDYHFDIDRVYDRPVTTQGAEIGKIVGKLHSFSQGDTVEDIAAVTIAVDSLNAAEFTITHDGCADGELVLTGATVVGDVTYNTYSTKFVAAPADYSFTATLSGYPANIRDASFERAYTHDSGEVREYNNPIASDPTLAAAMYDRYYDFETATRYEFTMRDDPAVDTGDYVYLDTLSSPAGIPVLVESIERTFNGGIDGRYVVVDANLEAYPAPEQPEDTDAANHTADDPQAIGAVAIADMSTDSIVAYDLGDEPA